MSERCTGHCCRVFHLPYSPEEMEAKKSTIQDGEFIADMIILLGKGKSWPDCPSSELGGESYFYTCKHFDGTNCTAYEKRPNMCRLYPYGNACKYEGCTMKETPDVQLDGLLSKMKEKYPGLPGGMLAEVAGALLTPDVREELAKEEKPQPKPEEPEEVITLEDRVRRLEAIAHPPVDITAISIQLADTVARMVEADPHQWSSRPCSTCRAISSLIGRSFGCMAKAK